MLKNTCDQRGIEFAYTSKLLFGEYTSSMTIRMPKAHPHLLNYKNHLTYAKARAGYAHRRWEMLISIIGDLGTARDWEYKINQSSITFYFKTPAQLEEAVIDVIDRGFLVARVSSPRNIDDMDQMILTPNKTVRPTLWHGRYRFRIELKRRYGTHNAITSVLHNVFGGEMSERKHPAFPNVDPTPCLKINDAQAHYNDNRILYVAEEEDVFLIRIALHENIYRIEECILSKDISNETSSTAEAY